MRVEYGQVLPIPAGRRARYAPHAGTRMQLGLRPEHLTEAPRHGSAALTIAVDVVEPMGMETLAHFRLGTIPAGLAGETLTARLVPETPARPGETTIVQADMNQMHLLDPASGQVL